MRTSASRPVPGSAARTLGGMWQKRGLTPRESLTLLVQLLTALVALVILVVVPGVVAGLLPKGPGLPAACSYWMDGDNRPVLQLWMGPGTPPPECPDGV